MSSSAIKRKSTCDSSLTNNDTFSSMLPPRPQSHGDNISINEPTIQNDVVDSPHSPPGDKSLFQEDKSRSHVWEHFTKLRDSKGVLTGRAICVWCHGNYQGKSEKGTSSLWRHLREVCKKFPHKKDLSEAQKNKDKTQPILVFNKPPDNKKAKLVCHSFDQETCRRDLVRMIVIDELPFRTVEKRGKGLEDQRHLTS
ncbi:hypothetical protein M5689_020880 [Euphorbia peplus]|nr:hypothetical protein M5689_020880 [Euphorbia peplus]